METRDKPITHPPSIATLKPTPRFLQHSCAVHTFVNTAIFIPIQPATIDVTEPKTKENARAKPDTKYR